MRGTWGIALAVLLAAPSIPNIPGIPGLPMPGGPTFSVPPPTGGPAPSVPAPPLFPRSDSVTMTVAPDGSLAVRELVAVPRGEPMTRTVPLRASGRVYGIRDANVDGAGSVQVTADAMTIRLDGGAATVKYTVDGAVAGATGGHELRWQPVSGWNRELLLARISLTAPRPPLSITCLAGVAGSATPCQTVRTDAKMITRVAQLRVPTGDRIDLAAVLDPASVAVNAKPAADTAEPDEASPFAVTWFSGAGLIALLALLLAGFALLWLVRARDAKPAARPPLPLLHQDDGHVVFTPPDGVPPGLYGAGGLAATVVELAVRGYLLVVQGVTADGRPDWQLVRNQPPDAGLSGYERALLDALLPPGTESVSLADLHANPPRLAQVRHARDAEVRARGLADAEPHAERARFALAGAVLTVLGVLVTLVLAFTVGNALIGLGVVVAGVVVLVGSRWAPAQTGQGDALRGAAGDLVHHLSTTVPAQLPAADRENVFARSLPYAMVLGHAPHWLHAFAGADTGEGRHWFVAGERPRSFAEEFPAFHAALDAALAG